MLHHGSPAQTSLCLPRGCHPVIQLRSVDLTCSFYVLLDHHWTAVLTEATLHPHNWWNSQEPTAQHYSIAVFYVLCGQPCLLGASIFLPHNTTVAGTEKKTA